MATTVTFAGRVVAGPDLLYTRDGTPFVTCRVLVNSCPPDAPGAWVDELVAHHVRIYGSAATQVHESLGVGDPIIVHGLQRTETWLDQDSGERRTTSVVEIDNRFGEVGVSLR